MNTDRRIRLLLSATDEQLAVIDGALTGQTEQEQQSYRLFTFVEAASAMGVSRQTVWRAIRDGRLRKVRIGEGSFRIPEAELRRFAGVE